MFEYMSLCGVGLVEELGSDTLKHRFKVSCQNLFCEIEVSHCTICMTFRSRIFLSIQSKFISFYMRLPHDTILVAQ